MNIPEQVKNEARALIEQYGDTSNTLVFMKVRKPMYSSSQKIPVPVILLFTCMTVKKQPK